MADKQQLSIIEKSVKQAKGKVSPADLSAETGYSLGEVSDALNRLLELYESKVSLDSTSGELSFQFKYPLVKRGSKTLSEISYDVLNAVWKGFQAVYKASIAVILVLYTIVFTIILLILMSRGMGGDRDNGGPSRIIGGIFRAIFEALHFMAIARTIEYAGDPSGMRYKRYTPEKNKGKKFIQSVFHFVFGPEMPEYDPLDDDREAAAYIRKNRYKITAGKIIELTGVDYDEADSRLAKYISKFDGIPQFDTEGVLVVEFPRLANKISGELKGGKIEYYKDEVEPPYELTGNEGGRNFLISALNTFNLIMSVFILNTLAAQPGLVIIAIVLGWFPFVFSALFFLIPILRILYIMKKKEERANNIIRKKLIGAIADAKEIELTKNDLYHYAHIKQEEYSRTEAVLNKILIDLKGEVKLKENGEAVYSFPRFSAELAVLD